MFSFMSPYLATWTELVAKHGDPRTANFAMMSSPIPSALICLAYFVLVSISPRIMKNREPFQLKQVLVVYNLAMIVLSVYLFYEFLMSGWLFDYSFGCQPVDFSDSPSAIRMANVCWVFYASKFVELLDTVFFIMRKKFNQVSFLHVFHHGIMPVSWWFGVRFVPGGFGTFHALINSFIHLLMYFYYFLSAFGTRFERWLFWKRYMTSMQMIQFVAVMLHSAQLLFIKCDYPMLFVYWIALYAVIFLVFFANFYVQEYYLRRNGKNKSNNSSGSGSGSKRLPSVYNEKRRKQI